MDDLVRSERYPYRNGQKKQIPGTERKRRTADKPDRRDSGRTQPIENQCAKHRKICQGKIFHEKGQ